MSDIIDYGNLMHDAMRGLIQRVLSGIAEVGALPGDHHFFITFDTRNSEVELADWLKERYPEEMTIVIQNWFADLIVTDEGFSITLNFGDNPEPMSIPYAAILTFVDPSVEFGLRFEIQENELDVDIDINDDIPEAGFIDVEEEPHRDAEIVSLDSFRK